MAMAKPHSLQVGYSLHAITMTANNSPLLLKKSDVCDRLALSLRTLEGMVKAGTFPPPVRMGKHVLWSQTAVESWRARMFGPQEAWRPNL